QRRKSFGKATPWLRSAASFDRRSAMSMFSSAGGAAGVSVMAGSRAAAWGEVWREGSGSVGALGAGVQAGLEGGLDELVQVAVEHLLGVAALDAGAQVLDAALVEHVVADLAAPADVRLGRLHRIALGVALLHLQLVELGRQHLHGAVAVGVLAALGLAGHDDAAGHMGDAHGR